MITWLKGQVIARTEWHKTLISIKVATEKLNFIPGQFTIIGLEHNNTILHRPYSLVNTPEADLEIHLNLVQAGEFSPLLFQLQNGDDILISNRPSGLLTLDEVPDVPHLWLFATGTGIGPFISILKTQTSWQRFQKITVAYSVKTQADMAYLAFFRQLQTQYPDLFNFVPIITREIIAGTQHTRITELISSGELERLTGHAFNNTTSHVMLCGNANMLDDVTLLLEQRGLTKHSRREPGNIAIEKYY